MFDGPKHVDALVYISNRLEGTTPAEGYIEQILEGLTDALHFGEELDLYKEYLRLNQSKD